MSNFKKMILQSKWTDSFYKREYFLMQSKNIDDDTDEKEFIMTCKSKKEYWGKMI